MTNQDIIRILDTLVYEGTVEMECQCSQGAGVSMDVGEGGDDIQRFYRLARTIFQDTGFNKIPCGICPVS